MSSYRQTITSPAVCEKTTSRLTLQLTDEADEELASSQLTTLTLTLYAKGSPSVLNACDAASILNTGRGSITVGGLLTITLAPDDNALAYTGRESEVHVALLEWTWASGAKSGKKEIEFTVVNQAKVT